MRVPVESSFGRIITIFFTKLLPGQMRIYCRPATEAQKEHFKNMGHSNALFSRNQPLGERSVRKLIKSGSKKWDFRVLLATLSGVSSLPRLPMTLM